MWRRRASGDRSSIFLSPLDVHVNRVPASGEVMRIEQHRGRHLPAYRRDAASANERTEVWLGSANGIIVFRQVVGVLARRIVCRLTPGQRVQAGERFGIMKFGSRMDVFSRSTRHSASGWAIASAAENRYSRRFDRRPTVPVSETGRLEVDGGQGRVFDGRPGHSANVRVPLAHVDHHPERFRRGVYLLPSLLTLANMFCGYACVVYTMRGDYETAAPFIGFAIVLDMLDGRIARLIGTTSAFGLRVRFAGRRHLVRHGAGDPGVFVGPRSARPPGWAAGFLFVTAAALRLARFNIQSAKAPTSGISSACRARRRPAFRRPPCSLSGRPSRLPREAAAGARDGAGARRS